MIIGLIMTRQSLVIINYDKEIFIMRKFYIALVSLIGIMIIWFLGTIYLLGIGEVLSSNLRGGITAVLIYLIVVLRNAIRLNKEGGEALVQTFFKERKEYLENYYNRKEKGDDI